MLRVRMDKETLDKLDKYCQQKNLTRSETVRRGLQVLCDQAKK